MKKGIDGKSTFVLRPSKTRNKETLFKLSETYDRSDLEYCCHCGLFLKFSALVKLNMSPNRFLQEMTSFPSYRERMINERKNITNSCRTNHLLSIGNNAV